MRPQVLPDDVDKVAQFFDILFGEKNDDLYICVWTLKDKKVEWFKNLTRAAKYVERRAEEDIYTCVSFFESTKERKHERAAGIVGFWVDIDFQAPYRKKGNLPKDLETVKPWIEGHGYDPSIIVQTGNGIQPWWLFKELWAFENEEEFQRAEKLCERFQYTIRKRAQGHTIDSTYKFNQVLRIPGTLHSKSGNRIKILNHSESLRYNPDDLEQFLLQLPDRPSTPESYTIPEINLKDLPPFDFGKIHLFCEVDPVFRQTWHRERDFPSDDDSDSVYDLSLASFGVSFEMTDGEIAAMIVKWHLMHNTNIEKVTKRKDYVAGRIAKARATRATTEAEKTLEEIQPPQSGVTNEYRNKILKTLSAVCQVELQRVEKQDGENPSYTLFLKTGESVIFRSIKEFSGRQSFRQHIAKRTSKWPKISNRKWDNFFAKLLECAVVVETGPELRDKEQTEEWLKDYIEARPPTEEIEDGVALQQAIIHKERCHIRLESFWQWLQARKGYRDNTEQLVFRLKRCACERGKINVPRPKSARGKRTSRVTWILPEHLWKTQD